MITVDRMLGKVNTDSSRDCKRSVQEMYLQSASATKKIEALRL